MAYSVQASTWNGVAMVCVGAGGGGVPWWKDAGYAVAVVSRPQVSPLTSAM